MTAKKKIPTVEPAARTPGKPSPKKSPVPSIEEQMTALSVREPPGNGFLPFNFDARYCLVTTVTGYLKNGTLVANLDYLVNTTHVDNFTAVVSRNGDKLKLSSKVPKVFLDLVTRGRAEFDASSPLTGVFMSGLRSTTNALVSAHGSDLDNIYSKGQVDVLPFPCRPNPSMQILWHDGKEKLFRRLMRNGDIDANAKHQMTAILRVTVEAQDKQRMGIVRVDDAVLHRRSANSSFGDSTPPSPPGRPFSAYYHCQVGSEFAFAHGGNDDFSVASTPKLNKQQRHNKRKSPTATRHGQGNFFDEDYVYVERTIPFVSDNEDRKEGEDDGEDAHMGDGGGKDPFYKDL